MNSNRSQNAALSCHLQDCYHNAWGVVSRQCTHARDVGVICGVSSVPVRLVGGPTSKWGRLEVQVAGIWGTVSASPAVQTAASMRVFVFHLHPVRFSGGLLAVEPCRRSARTASLKCGVMSWHRRCAASSTTPLSTPVSSATLCTARCAFNQVLQMPGVDSANVLNDGHGANAQLHSLVW